MFWSKLSIEMDNVDIDMQFFHFDLIYSLKKMKVMTAKQVSPREKKERDCTCFVNFLVTVMVDSEKILILYQKLDPNVSEKGKILVSLSFCTAISTHYLDYYASCNISVLTKISANHVHEFL